MNCPCGSTQTFATCCEPLLNGERSAASAEGLMRSRYSAFATKNLPYIIETTDPQARLEIDEDNTRAWMEGSRFTKLEVLRAEESGNKATVEFKAYFQTGDGPEQIHHEVSKFRRHAGRWYFRDGRAINWPT